MAFPVDCPVFTRSHTAVASSLSLSSSSTYMERPDASRPPPPPARSPCSALVNGPSI